MVNYSEWTMYETWLLIRGLIEHGGYRDVWKRIQSDFRYGFNFSRSAVDLKDRAFLLKRQEIISLDGSRVVILRPE